MLSIVVIGRNEADNIPRLAASIEALIEYCRAHLARYKVPETVEFMVDLPMSAAGKVLKRTLREWSTSAG